MRALLLLSVLATLGWAKPLVDELHGIIVEKDLPIDRKTYPSPQYIAPLFVSRDGAAVLHVATGPPGTCYDPPVGYAPAACLDSQLLPLQDFTNNYCLPKNVGFKLLAGAQPIMDRKKQ